MLAGSSAAAWQTRPARRFASGGATACRARHARSEAMMQSRVAGRRGARAHVCNAIRARRAPRIAGHAAADDPGCHLANAEIGLTVPANRIRTSLYPIAEMNQEAPLSQTSGTRSPSPLGPATELHLAGTALQSAAHGERQVPAHLAEAAARASAMACLKACALGTPGMRKWPMMKAGVPRKPRPVACS